MASWCESPEACGCIATWTAAYTYGNALLRRNAEVPLYDALGSERTVTDGSGSVTGSIVYEAFGQPRLRWISRRELLAQAKGDRVSSGSGGDGPDD